MKLGIGSIAFLYDNIINKRFDYSHELLYDAFERTLIFAEDNGIGICEFMLDPPEILLSKEKSRFIKLFDSFPSIDKQFHAPYVDLNLCSLNEWIRKATIKVYEQNAEFAHEVNADLLTIHPGSMKFLHHSYRNVYNKLRDSVKELLERISDLEVIICLENMQNKSGIFLNVDEITKFFKETRRNDLYFTWDTGHSWTSNLDVEELWKNLHSKIKNIHLVDNYYILEDTHPELGSGNVNFSKVFEISQEYDYEGSYIMELHNAEDLSNSLDYIYKYL
jgi:sugar phosphate isomerase/epimerase